MQSDLIGTVALCAGPAAAETCAAGAAREEAACARPRADEILKALLPAALRVAGDGPRRIIAELTVPVSRERVDLVIVSDEIWCYEIKSDRDSLRRLPRQVEAFERIGHRCVLAAAPKHIERARSTVPEHWGLLEAGTGDSFLRWHRRPTSNPNLDRNSLLRLLWRDEAEAALEAIDGKVRCRKRRHALLAELGRRLTASELETCVRRALLERRPHDDRIAVHALVR